MFKPAFLVLPALFCAAMVPAHAQDVPDARPNAAPRQTSLETLLPMQSGQMKKLNRLYDDYSSRRASDLDLIGRQQNRIAASSTLPALDENRDELEDDIRAAKRRVADDLRATRVKAMEVLTSLQRAQLEAFAVDPRFQLRADELHHLLVLPVDEVAQLPLANPNRRSYETARAPKRRRVRGTGNYGVYGGYGYGRPDVGVYGGYQQGAVGVQGGIGRGGPSIGVNIGGVFARIR